MSLKNRIKLRDTAKHQGLRNQLVSLLQKKGIHDMKVLQAMQSIPRHFFLESGFEDFAYQDKAFPIGAGQTISQPYTVAFQSQLLEVKADDKILEIGTGSGYQTAVLCKMGAKVFTIERQIDLYNGIIVTAGAPFIPQPLMAQLKIGGRLVIPVGEDKQIMTLLIRKSETHFEQHEFGDFRFVPMLEDKNR